MIKGFSFSTNVLQLHLKAIGLVRFKPLSVDAVMGRNFLTQ